MKPKFARITAIALLMLCRIALTVTAQTYTLETVPNPKQNSSPEYVSNPDHILSVDATQQINTALRKLEDSTTAQVAVVCLNSIGENVPKEFATALFRKWGLGYKEKNNGLLILLIKDQHRIEMETGYGLEGILPDGVCSRIQTQNMIPLAKTGNFDGAMIAGTAEIVRIISQPKAAVEVYDQTKYTENQPLEDSAIFVLFLLLIPCLLLIRLVSFLSQKRNSVANQIEQTVSTTKWRVSRAILIYVVGPFAIGLIVIYLRKPLFLEGWQIMTVMYAYTIVAVWDWRRKRVNAFTKRFGAMTETQRYDRRKALRFNGWNNILLFPMPFAWFKIKDDREMDFIRNHSRRSANGFELTRVQETEKERFLNDYQKIEEQINSVDYDVWQDEQHQVTEVIGYENLTNETYSRCSKCKSRAMSVKGKRIVTEATTEQEGRGITDYECKACGQLTETPYKIKMLAKSTASTAYSSTTSSSSGSSSSQGGSPGGSSSSWGGGSSGGGGAGSNW